MSDDKNGKALEAALRAVLPSAKFKCTTLQTLEHRDSQCNSVRLSGADTRSSVEELQPAGGPSASMPHHFCQQASILNTAAGAHFLAHLLNCKTIRLTRTHPSGRNGYSPQQAVQKPGFWHCSIGRVARKVPLL